MDHDVHVLEVARDRVREHEAPLVAQDAVRSGDRHAAERESAGVAVSDAPEKHRAQLSPVPHPGNDGGSNVTARAKLHLRGQELSVLLKARGLSGDLPHAMHIHGKDAGELAFCPGADRADDLRADGLIETAEGLEDYGPVQVSFTTVGDTGPGSVLALDRFPVATRNGHLTYRRTFQIPADIAANLDEKHIVIHGEDINGNGTYDAEPKSAGLGVSLEAELPVACGEIDTK